jgi:hypothetical protein
VGATETATGGRIGELLFSLIPTPPSRLTVLPMMATLAVLLDPLLNCRAVVGKSMAPVRVMLAPPPKLLDSAVLLIVRS